MSDETVTELLERLSSGRVDAAWNEFLARYSPLIMHVIRRYDAGDDRTTACFVHVCGALSDDGFRRLLSFRPDGPARFRTWLMAGGVVALRHELVMRIAKRLEPQ